MIEIQSVPDALDEITGVEWPREPDPMILRLLRRAAKKSKPSGHAAAPVSGGNAQKTDANIFLVLGVEPRVAPLFRYDEFSDQVLVGKAVVDEALVFHISVWLERVYKLSVGVDRVLRGLAACAKRNPFHPVRDYLSMLSWDGQGRIDLFLHDYMNTPDNSLTRKLSACWFLSSVARALAPGCKVDTTLILAGKQGTRKSQTLAALVPKLEWFSDTPLDLRSKDCYLAIQGRWIYELAELHGIHRSDVARVKAFLSSQRDNYRPPYGRLNVVRERHVIFVGSTNEQEFLSDPTGSRRFWPVLTGECHPGSVPAVRDALWAEAVVRYRTGEQWWLDASRETQLNRSSERFQLTDPWEEPVRDWLARNGPRPFVISEVLERACSRGTGDQSGSDAVRVVRILTKLGCVKYGNRRINGERRNWWKGPPVQLPLPEGSNVIPLEIL